MVVIDCMLDVACHFAVLCYCCVVVAQIPQSSEGKAWYSYVDPNVTATMLEGAVIV